MRLRILCRTLYIKASQKLRNCLLSKYSGYFKYSCYSRQGLVCLRPCPSSSRPCPKSVSHLPKTAKKKRHPSFSPPPRLAEHKHTSPKLLLVVKVKLPFALCLCSSNKQTGENSQYLQFSPQGVQAGMLSKVQVKYCLYWGF